MERFLSERLMSTIQATVRGMLKPDGTLTLDERLALPPGPVQVIVRQLEEKGSPRPDLAEVIEQIQKGRIARADEGLSQEEMEATIGELREDAEYEERWRQIWGPSGKSPGSTESP
jgi:hypothetical protein